MKSKSHGTGSQLPKALREALLCSPLWGQVHAGAAELSGASLLPRGAQLGPPSPVPLALSRLSQCHSLRQRAGSLRTGALCLIRPSPQSLAPSPALRCSIDSRRGGLAPHRHGVPVPREGVQVLAAPGLPNQDELAAVARGLWG